MQRLLMLILREIVCHKTVWHWLLSAHYQTSLSELSVGSIWRAAKFGHGVHRSGAKAF